MSDLFGNHIVGFPTTHQAAQMLKLTGKSYLNNNITVKYIRPGSGKVEQGHVNQLVRFGAVLVELFDRTTQ